MIESRKVTLESASQSYEIRTHHKDFVNQFDFFRPEKLLEGMNYFWVTDVPQAANADLKHVVVLSRFDQAAQIWHELPSQSHFQVTRRKNGIFLREEPSQ